MHSWLPLLSVVARRHELVLASAAGDAHPAACKAQRLGCYLHGQSQAGPHASNSKIKRISLRLCKLFV